MPCHWNVPLKTRYSRYPLGYPNCLKVSRRIRFLSLMGGTYLGVDLSPSSQTLPLSSIEIYLLCLATLAFAAMESGISSKIMYLSRALSKVTSRVHRFLWKEEQCLQCHGPYGRSCSAGSTQFLWNILSHPQHSRMWDFNANLHIPQFYMLPFPS